MSDSPIYRADASASRRGTSRMGGVVVAPLHLTLLFGPPILDDGDIEGMGSYTLVGPEDVVVTIYFRANDIPRADIVAAQPEFWASGEGVLFGIGGRSAQDAESFRLWLLDRCSDLAANHPLERTRS